MGEKILLIFAYLDGEPVAGAMNVIGETTLFGRYWGCRMDIPFLHFELCYYQAIDAAIARGLSRVEAGAQGGHKLARGYAPVQTRSAHFIADPGLREAVAEFLEREAQGIDAEQNFLEARTPFKNS
jgi:predicted N-acyltransferase